MKRILLFVGVAVVIVIGFILLAKPASSPEHPAQKPAASQNYQAILAKVQTGKAALLDVRTPEEYSAGHFADSVNLPLQSLQSGTLPDSAKSVPLYVYCRSGNRSAQAAAILQKAGYSVTDLGGLDDVKALGGQLTTH